MHMTNSEQREAFELIVPTLNDEVISAFLTLAKVNHEPVSTDIEFTTEQLEQIDQSFDDFKNGRVMSFREAIDGVREQLNLRP